MPVASSKEFGFKFDLRTKGGTEAAKVFGNLAASMAKLASTSSGTRNSIGEIRNNIAILTGHVTKLSSKFNVLSKDIKRSTHDQTPNVYRLAASLGALSFVANKVGAAFLNTASGVGKSLFEIGTTFEYIKSGLDFAFGFRAQEMMTKAMNVAQETNVSTREVLDVTRSLGVLKINPFADMLTKKGQIQSSLQSLADLAALVPQQGMEGALFAIRNALSGQWRSLQMRFDIPLNMIEEIRSKITATMTTQQRFDTIMQGITDKFGGMMQSVSHTTKFYVDNIKDVVTNLAYDVFQKASKSVNPFFEEVFNYFKHLREDKVAIENLSNAFTTMTKAIKWFATGMFHVVKFIGALVTAHPNLMLVVAGGTALTIVVSKLIGLLAGIGSSLLFASSGMNTLTTSIKGATGSAKSFSMTWKGIRWSIGISAAITALTLLISKIYDAKTAVDRFNKISGEAPSGTGMAKAGISGEIATNQLRKLASFSSGNETPNEKERGLIPVASMNWDKEGKSFDSLYNSMASNLKTTLLNRKQTMSTEEWAGISNDLKNMGLYKYITGETDETPSIKDMFSDLPNLTKESVLSLANRVEALGKGSRAFSQIGHYKQEQTEEATNVFGDYMSAYNATTDARKRSVDALLKEAQTINPKANRSSVEAEAFRLTNVPNKGLSDIMSSAAYRKSSLLRTATAGALSEYLKSYAPGGLHSYSSSMSTSDAAIPAAYPRVRELLGNELLFPGGLQETVFRLQKAGVGKTPKGMRIPGQYEENPGGLSTEAAREWITKNITSEAQALNVDLPDDIKQFFKDMNLKLTDIKDSGEDIADNTRKTEELLPPIFRRIFDDFTRRERRAEMGANALYGRLAMAR